MIDTINKLSLEVVDTMENYDFMHAFDKIKEILYLGNFNLA